MTPWEDFFKEKMTHIVENVDELLDIGAGLRAIPGKGNKFDKKRAWLGPYLEKIKYIVMDPVPDYEPDVVGDIHKMPFEDDSVPAISCIAVLEHVEDPMLAVREVHRVLKPGGYAMFYVPFLFYYHADRGYYKDYWRFTHDALDLIFKDFKVVEKARVRGALGTWMHISPLGKIGLIKWLAQVGDKITGKLNSNQVSGYYIYLEK